MAKPPPIYAIDDDPYVCPDYTSNDVIAACDVLLHSGFHEEAVAILIRVFGNRDEFRKALMGQLHG